MNYDNNKIKMNKEPYELRDSYDGRGSKIY